MAENEKIHFILTGGTIDSYFDTVQATTIPGKQSSIPSYVRDIIKLHPEVTFETIAMLDSKDLTDKIRNSMASAIQKSPAAQIIVAHGTDRMVETLEFLETKRSSFLNKTIVVTGAFVPLEQFAMSDAGFNLGYAVSAVQTLDPGVYLCMNARIFPAGTVQKNRQKARFEEK